MDQIADMQAQIVALRTAVEGLWLSMMHADPARIEQAERMRSEMLAGLARLEAPTPEAAAMREAVSVHTDQLWKSIIWQLGGLRDEPTAEA